ncbi:hypothetical protein Tco_1348095 [Tanacetum coccineum]
MAESSSQKTSSPEITPKEEHVTLDKPESPTPFLPASQADFTFDEITFTTNNVVELIYPLHPKQDYFEAVSYFIYKCYLKEAFTRAHNQYKEYLSKVWYTAKTLDDSKVWISSPIGGVRGEIGITTFRNALRAQYLPHSSMYVSLPSITIVRPWFATIRYRGEIGSKETLKKSCLPSRWRLLMAQIMHYLGGKIGGLDQISNKDATILYCLVNGVHVDYEKIIWEDLVHKLNKKTREKIVPYPTFLSLLPEHTMPEYENEELTINPTQVFNVPVDSKALKPSSQTEEVPQGKKLGAKKKETKSSSAKDKSPSHPSPPTLVVGEMHKEAQQATGDPTSLGATRHDASADSTAEADPGLSPPNDSIHA